MATDITEKGLETIIVKYLREKNGYVQYYTDSYDKDYALVDIAVEDFIKKTQPKKVDESMCFKSVSERNKFFNRLRDDITKRGVTDVLRKGFKFNGNIFDLYYPLPSELNPTAQELYKANIFMVIRQLKYSKLNENSIDFIILINGLPVATFELKNHFTGQTVDNAIRQYQTDRDPKELLLMPKRCAVHFAVDDTSVMMCTKLAGKESWFLPFNKGVNGGAGNPVNPNGLATAYLWESILTKESLSNIIENFAQVIVEEDKKTHKKKEKVIWPRYHQLDVVRKLLQDTAANNIGKRFLIQHSAGSGKSNSITWLAYQLVTLLKDQKQFFDSVIVVTDRVNLDKQIRDNINAFAKLTNLVGWADSSETLRTCLQGGKKIIITTIHKFSFILEEIGSTLKNKKFAIIIDEAHSSQNGSMSASMSMSVSGNGFDDSDEDEIQDAIIKIIEGRKMAKNANYYAFTATPKNKTLEMFGVPFNNGTEIGHRPFHEYTMKQAIEEGFILDVLKNYTPYDSYYRVLKISQEDPLFDKAKAPGKIRAYIEAQPETIDQKAQIIVDHFCTKVFSKIGGKARAMVVTSSIERAIKFYMAITHYLKDRNSPYRAIVAFSGTKEVYDDPFAKETDGISKAADVVVPFGKAITEADINQFPSAEIEERMEMDPYRILVVANKFQTGYDQPLLHTMYVDKQLSDLKAVQTLSRLNRCHPKKLDTFILDFCNDPEVIRMSFQRYYKTTILGNETDPNKLNDLTDEIESFNFYTEDDLENVVKYKLSGNDEDVQLIHTVLDANVQRFKKELDMDQQVKCKGDIKSFCRIYPFLASIIQFSSPMWEKQYIFYSLLLRKLPKLAIVDGTEGILDLIDFDKYRLVKAEERSISLENENAEIKAVPVSTGGTMVEPEMDLLSKIVQDFNEQFGGIEWKNVAEAQSQVNELPKRLAKSQSFVNAVKNSDEQTAQIQFNQDMQTIVASMLEEKTEFVQNYFQNPSFQKFVNERVFRAAYQSLR